MLQHQQLVIPGKPLYRKINSGYNQVSICLSGEFSESHIPSLLKCEIIQLGFGEKNAVEESEAVIGRCGSFLKTLPGRHYTRATVWAARNLTESQFFSESHAFRLFTNVHGIPPWPLSCAQNVNTG